MPENSPTIPMQLTCSDFDHWPKHWQDTARDWLCAGEHERLARLGSHTRRDQFLAGRLLLRQCIAEVFAREPADIGLAASAPVSAVDSDGHRLCFTSISHAASWITVALSPHPVGVDCERQLTRRSWREISAQYFSVEEAAWLRQLSAERGHRAFIRSWTAKEALSKCAGAELGRVLGQATLVDDETLWSGEFAGFHAWNGTLDGKTQASLVSADTAVGRIPDSRYRPGPFDRAGESPICLIPIPHRKS